MNQKEFWKELSKCRGFEVEGAYIRKISPAFYNGICPVCAVANRKRRKTEFDENHLDAAKYLGLNEEFADKIADASDTHTYRPLLRKKILKTLNLKDTPIK